MAETPARPHFAAAPLPRVQPWAALALAAFVLHWTWEMLQAPLYGNMQNLSFARATGLCTVASAGDVVLTLLAYGTVAAWVRSRSWLFEPHAAW